MSDACPECDGPAERSRFGLVCATPCCENYDRGFAGERTRAVAAVLEDEFAGDFDEGPAGGGIR